MTTTLGFINFYLPAINFILFAILFYLAFRSIFSSMAKNQRASYLKTKEQLNAQLINAQKQLDDLLFKEQELSKKLHLVIQQAKQDADLRAEQIIDDAKLKASQIIEESKRLLDAEHFEAQQNLKNQMIKEVQTMIHSQLLKPMTAQTKHQFLTKKLKDLSAVEK